MRLHRLVGLGTPLCGAELLAAGGLEDRPSALDDVAHVLCLEVLDLLRDEALEASVNSLDAYAVVDGGTCDGADGGVHPGGITSRGQYANTFDSGHIACLV